MSATTREDCVERGHRVGRSRHGAREDGFHEARGGHEEGRVAGSSGCGDYLTAPAEDRFGCQGDIHDLELAVADGCLIQGIGLAELSMV